MPQHTFAATDPDTYVEDVKAAWKPTVEGPRVVVEALEIQAPLVSTGALAGALVLPDPPAATWYEQTQPPGADKGATLIASHVDSGFGDAAPFSRLHAIKKGTPIEIRDAAGKTHKYKASSIQVYERQAVPREVFELTGKPRLVLVTCSGPTVNSGSAAHYLYNLVVVATPIS
ncbi:MAG: class F sortase [Arthrobacter sp.]|nr:class F sortase [Arthrobacter sp.]